MELYEEENNNKNNSKLQFEESKNKNNVEENNSEAKKGHKIKSKIQIPIDAAADPKDQRPLVIFYGSKDSGKSTMIVRLSRFLQNNGFIVSPFENFSTVEKYSSYTKMFKEDIEKGNIQAPNSTSLDGYLWINIEKDSKHRFSILEAPGENFFDEKKDEPYPSYLQEIMSFPKLRRIWIFILESGAQGDGNNMNDSGVRTLYAIRIQKFMDNLRKGDRAIIVYNKADKDGITANTLRNGKHKTEHVINAINNYYSNILNFDCFSRRGFLFGRTYKVPIIPFISGKFSMEDNGKTFTQGDDYFPQMLFDVITKAMKG